MIKQRNLLNRTTEFTLKRIVENLDKIPNKGFSEETPKLSAEQKKKLMEMASMFETFGEYLGKEDQIMNSAKSMAEFCTLAESYAVNECGDWFQQEIVKKDMATMRKHVSEYQKSAKECYAKMQQLGVLFEDVRHLASRYYDLKKIAENMGSLPSQPMTLGEDKKIPDDKPKKCSKCKKTFTPSYGEYTRCQSCAAGDAAAGEKATGTE